MGVYALVQICIDRTEPLSADERVALVELAVKHQLITKHCAVSVPEPLPPRGLVDRVKALFGVRTMYARTVEEGEPGPWVAERVRATAPELSVSSGFPTWKGEILTGPFVYTSYARPKPVEVFNAYRSPDERHPREPPDGVIGRFFDVVAVHAKRDFDARSAASSGFVRDLKKLTSAKVICRTSWY